MEKAKGKAIWCVMVTFMVLLFVNGNGNAAPPVVKEWRIPSIFFLTGPIAGDAAVHKWLVDEAVADMNASGGIRGKPVVLEYLDSALDPSKSTAAMAKAIDMNALCVIGPLADLECKAAMPLAVREGIFAFSGSVMADIAKEFNPWTISITMRNQEFIQHTLPPWLKQEPSIKSVVIFVEPIFPTLTEFANGDKEVLAKHGVKSQIIEVPVMVVDYSPSIVKALDTGADAFVVLATQQTSAKILKDLVRRKMNPRKFWFPHMTVGQAFFEEAKGYTEGIYSADSPTWEFTPTWAKYNTRYNKAYPGKYLHPFSYVPYDMLIMIKKAIEAQEITGDPAKLKEERIRIRDYALNQKGFKGIKYTFDVENGIQSHSPVLLFQVRNGKAVLVDTIIP